jgi:tetratricopeptide (TPR) repeat protein
VVARVTPAGNYLAGRHANTEREMAAAVAYYRAALRADPKNELLVERTFLSMLASGVMEEAMPLAERLIGIDKAHRVARLALAMRAIKRGQYTRARTHLSQSVRGPIADLTAALISAWAQLGAGEARAAVETLDKLPGPDWYDIFKNLHGGLILDAAGHRKEAGVLLEKAYRTDQTALRTVEGYARWASRADQRDVALKVYEDFAKVLPRHPIVELSVAELKAGRSLPALVRTPRAGAAEVLYGLGSSLGRQGGEDLALVYLQLALYLEPQHPVALAALGDLYENLKKPQHAIEVYARVPANSPLKRNAEVHRALNLDQLERTDEARRNLEALIAAKPDDIEAIMALGNVLRARKFYKEAAETYTKAIGLLSEPERAYWTLYYFRGICYERSKQWPLAEKDFQQALALYPDQPQVLNYLGYSWVDQGQHLEKAIEMIRKAVSLRPNDGYIVDSLGWAFYRLGRYDEAVRELERAIELRPEDPVINDHLGDAYWKIGRKLESFFQWRHAKDLKPEPEDLEKIQVKLVSGLVDEPIPEAPKQQTPPAEEPAKTVAPSDNKMTVARVPDKPATDEPKPKLYTVKKGDTLWDIAETYYGTGKGADYGRIFEANKSVLRQPGKIYPGQVLSIPTQ